MGKYVIILSNTNIVLDKQFDTFDEAFEFVDDVVRADVTMTITQLESSTYKVWWDDKNDPEYVDMLKLLEWGIDEYDVERIIELKEGEVYETDNISIQKI